MMLTRRDLARAFAAGATGLMAAPRAQAAAIVPSVRTVCATCAFWKGPRLPSMDKRSVIVANGAKGRCLNPQSPFAGLETVPEQGFPQGWRRAPGLM